MTAELALIIATSITFCSSLLVLLFSTLSTNKKIRTDAVTINRIKWIEDVRLLMHEFIVEYMKSSSCDSTKLLVIKAKIDLHIRFDVGNKGYDDLKMVMEECLNNEYKDVTQYNHYIKVCQKVLSDVWVRAKIEAGMGKRIEKDIVKSISGNK